MKEVYVKVYTYIRILEHLQSKLKDPRKKERLRVELALQKIAKWHEEGEKRYDERFRQRSKGFPKEAAKKLVRKKSTLHKQ